MDDFVEFENGIQYKSSYHVSTGRSSSLSFFFFSYYYYYYFYYIILILLLLLLSSNNLLDHQSIVAGRLRYERFGPGGGTSFPARSVGTLRGMTSLTTTGRRGELGTAIEAAGGGGTAPRGAMSRNLVFESGAVDVAISQGGDGTASRGAISRMLVFESGAVYVASHGGDSILLEAHGECFTLVFANGTHRQHVTKYAPRCTHHMLKNAILFKNAHHTKATPKGRNRTSSGYPPPFFCPDVFRLLGIPFRTARHDHDPTADGNVHPRAADRLHWPKYTVYDDYCTVNTSDESVVVSSTDGLATLSLSPHEQIVRVTYPLMVPAESKSRVDERRENGAAAKSAKVVFVVAIDQIFPAQQCPAMFKHPYCLAKKLSALDLSEGNVNEGAEANDGCLHVVDALLPKCNVNSKDRAMNMYDWHDVTKSVSPLGMSWREECVELAKKLVPPYVPTIERVLVEWNEANTIWYFAPAEEESANGGEDAVSAEAYASKGTSPLVTYGVLLHDSNAYLHVVYESGFQNSDDGHVHEYLMHTNRFHSTYTCQACKEEHKSAVQYVQRLHRHHEACVTLRTEAFSRTKVSVDKGEVDECGSSQLQLLAYEDLATTSTVDGIAARLEHRESDRLKLLGKIESHLRRQPDIDRVLEQTRRFFERQKIEAKLLFSNGGLEGRRK